MSGPDSCPVPGETCGIEVMSPLQDLPEPAPQDAVAARVVAVDGTWACLWIPQTGDLAWVDLARVEHDPLES